MFHTNILIVITCQSAMTKVFMDYTIKKLKVNLLTISNHGKCDQ